MTTSYPGAIDTLTNPTPSDPLNSATVPHASQHANANDAIEAIQNTLGTNPQGGSASVKARLDAVDTANAARDTALAYRVKGFTSSNEPASPVAGDVWVDPDDSSLKIWNGSAWANPSNAGGGSGVPWASISGGTETVISDGGTNYTLHRFNGNGSLVCSVAGYVEVLLSGGGSGGHTASPGNAGDVIRGLFWLPAGTHAITVGAGGNDNGGDATGGATSIGTVQVTAVSRLGRDVNNVTGAAGTAADRVRGLTSTFTGNSVTYGTANVGAVTANTGNGGGVNIPGSSGVALIRVPA